MSGGPLRRKVLDTDRLARTPADHRLNVVPSASRHLDPGEVDPRILIQSTDLTASALADLAAGLVSAPAERPTSAARGGLRCSFQGTRQWQTFADG
jgi:hypothetical protein